MNKLSTRHLYEAAYTNTDYRVLLPRKAVTFRVGQYDAEAEAALKQHCRVEREWAIITPCNPNSEKSDEDANLTALARLRQELDIVGLRHYNAINQSPDGEWPELGYLIVDLDSAQAKALGRRYRQNAYVTATLGSAPRLVWLI